MQTSANSPRTINRDGDGNDINFDLSRFTTEQKLSWLGGADLWNLRVIPGVSATSTTSPTKATSICLSDGPHGLRKPLTDLTLQEAYPATCFPSACATACSWNIDLMERMGQALSLECRHYNVQVLLGPGVNLKRYPGGGRNHEYFSEDPLLTGMLAKSYISGVQESGRVAACIKHFCLNNQESNRMIVNVVVDERTMRELYLPAFEMSICQDGDKQQQQHAIPKLVMAAYNKVNGLYCCENKYLLQSILRDEWNFKGVVVSDWGAISDRVESIKAGMDLEMPGTREMGVFDKEVLECVKEEENSEEIRIAIDDCADRVVRLIAELDQDKDDVPDDQKTDHNQGNSDAIKLFDNHDQLARTIAQECIVMLQNRDNLLPLSKNETKNKIALIGEFAKGSPRYQGMGSAHVTPTKVTSVYSAMESLLFDKNDIDIDKGDDDDVENQKVAGSNDNDIPFARGYDADADDDEIEQHLIDEAVEVAKKPGVSVVIICVGLPEIMESEGFDRKHIRLPQQHIALVEAVFRVHSNVAVVLSNGGIVQIPQSFVDGAKSILDGFLLGQAGGHALVDVLFGIVSPSGKLPETIPIQAERDSPSKEYFPGTKDTVEYREGLDVGYRYFDTANIPVRFPFGHGLQYTNFEYSNLCVDTQQDDANTKRVVVSLDIQNSGSSSFSKPVMEVVQLYIRPIQSTVYRPYHELKSFCKVELSPGETKTAQFTLDARSFAFYDIGMRDWVVEKSTSFEIEVGASSRDIRLKETIQFQTGRDASKVAQESYPPMIDKNSAGNAIPGPKSFVVDDDVFVKRFGKYDITSSSATISVSSQIKQREKSFITRNTLLLDAANASWIASIMFYFVLKVGAKEVKEGPTKKRELRMIRANIENVPLRGLVIFSQGILKFKLLDFLILIMNGNYWTALGNIFFSKKTTTKCS